MRCLSEERPLQTRALLERLLAPEESARSAAIDLSPLEKLSREIVRYLLVVGNGLALHLVRAVRKHDSRAHVTLVPTTREALELSASSGADSVLESLERLDPKSIDVAVVQLESAGDYCELGRELKRGGVPLVVAFTVSGDPGDYGACGFDVAIPVGLLIESAVGSIVGFDSWVRVPTHEFAGVSLEVCRVFRRARLGVTLRDVLSEVSGVRGLVALYDKHGSYVTSGDYVLSEGDLVAVAAPTERDLVRAVERLNKLFSLAERVYAALESRRPPG